MQLRATSNILTLTVALWKHVKIKEFCFISAESLNLLLIIRPFSNVFFVLIDESLQNPVRLPNVRLDTPGYNSL